MSSLDATPFVPHSGSLRSTSGSKDLASRGHPNFTPSKTTSAGAAIKQPKHISRQHEPHLRPFGGGAFCVLHTLRTRPTGCDEQESWGNYAANLVTWQADIQDGSHAITGSKAVIPMLMGQCVYSLTGLAQLAVAMAHPATHVLVGPEYCIPHVTTAQIASGAVALHLGSYGERLMGEYFAKAYKRVVLQGRRWVPVVPTAISIGVRTIVVTFNVPEGALALDTSLVSDPGNFGFNYTDSGFATILGVAVTAPNQVTLTLSDPVHVGTATLTYAVDVTNQGTGNYGPLGGDRGCLRGTSTQLSFYPDASGNHTLLHDYCCAFAASF